MKINPRHLPLLAFLALAMGLWATMEYNPQPKLPVETVMPPFTLQKLGENEASTWQPTPGTITIVNFFATWCVPCLAEHPQITKLSKLDGVEVVGIAWNDQPAALNAWLEKHGNPFTSVWRDPSGRAAISAGLRGVPETFVLDATGKVRMHVRGAIHEGTAAEIESLVKEWQHAPLK